MLKLIGLGGTFDHLHSGHEFLIKTALSLGEKIVIGLATKTLLENKLLRSKMEDYETRKSNLIDFITEFAEIERVDIVPLNDPYGPPIDEPNYEGLIVSEESYQGGLKLNEKRIEKGYNPMILIVIPVLKDENGNKISSTTIRRNLP